MECCAVCISVWCARALHKAVIDSCQKSDTIYYLALIVPIPLLAKDFMFNELAEESDEEDEEDDEDEGDEEEGETMDTAT